MNDMPSRQDDDDSECELDEDENEWSSEPCISTLDDYRIPTIIHKNLREVLKDSTVLINSNKVAKFTNNLEGNLIKKEWFEGKEDPKIELTLHLLDFTRPLPLYKLKIAEKLERILKIKAVATEFFKLGNWK